MSTSMSLVWALEVGEAGVGRVVGAGRRGQLASDDAPVKGGPAGPAEGSPEGATLTGARTARSCGRVRERAH